MPSLFRNIELGESIIMPNHIHGVLIIKESSKERQGLHAIKMNCHPGLSNIKKQGISLEHINLYQQTNVWKYSVRITNTWTQRCVHVPISCQTNDQRYSLVYASPSAAGTCPLPMKPASTIMVIRYGAVDINVDGMVLPSKESFEPSESAKPNNIPAPMAPIGE